MAEKFKKGDRVKHATRTDWGLGEVIADQTEHDVVVLFEDVGIKKFLLSVATFEKVTGDEAASDYLSALVERERTRPKLAGKKATSFVPFSKSVEKFLRLFPEGFQDPNYLTGRTGEREYKVVASASMSDALGQGQFAGLIDEANYAEVCKRAKSIVNKTNLIFQYEKIWLGNGLSDDSNQQAFALALYNLLYATGPLEVRFERFIGMLYAIDAAKWTIATYFLFIVFPDSQMFVKPQVTQNAANALGMEINYRPKLNWLTYSLVLRLAENLKKKLASEGKPQLVPRDMIDVQSFIWVMDDGYTTD